MTWGEWCLWMGVSGGLTIIGWILGARDERVKQKIKADTSAYQVIGIETTPGAGYTAGGLKKSDPGPFIGIGFGLRRGVIPNLSVRPSICAPDVAWSSSAIQMDDGGWLLSDGTIISDIHDPRYRNGSLVVTQHADGTWAVDYAPNKQPDESFTDLTWTGGLWTQVPQTESPERGRKRSEKAPRRVDS